MDLTTTLSLIIGTTSIVLAIVAMTAAKSSEKASQDNFEKTRGIMHDIHDKTKDVLAQIDKKSEVIEKFTLNSQDHLLTTVTTLLTDVIGQRKFLEERRKFAEFAEEGRRMFMEKFGDDQAFFDDHIKKYSKGIIHITTDRLELRRFSDEDTEQFVAIMTDKTVTDRYFGVGFGLDRAGAERLLRSYENEWGGGHGVFAVIEKQSGNLIGHCGFSQNSDGRSELGFAYAPAFWGKGYATEAGKAVMAYAKEKFSLGETIAMTHPHNAASIVVLERLGFVHAGREEHHGSTLEVFIYNKNGGV